MVIKNLYCDREDLDFIVTKFHIDPNKCNSSDSYKEIFKCLDHNKNEGENVVIYIEAEEIENNKDLISVIVGYLEAKGQSYKINMEEYINPEKSIKNDKPL